MNKNRLINYPVVLITLLFANIVSTKQLVDTDATWTLWHQDNDVEIHFKKEISNKKVDKPIEIKACFTVQSSLSGFILFIQDTTNVSRWLDNAYKSTIIKQLSDNENIFITYFSGVWPLEPRDIVMKSKIVQHNDYRVEIISEDASEAVPMLKDSIRMKVFKAHWQLFPLKENKSIQVQYSLSIMPNGNIPKLLRDEMALKSMLTTIKNLKSQLPQSAWQGFQLQNISELPTTP